MVTSLIKFDVYSQTHKYSKYVSDTINAEKTTRTNNDALITKSINDIELMFMGNQTTYDNIFNKIETDSQAFTEYLTIFSKFTSEDLFRFAPEFSKVLSIYNGPVFSGPNILSYNEYKDRPLYDKAVFVTRPVIKSPIDIYPFRANPNKIEYGLPYIDYYSVLFLVNFVVNILVTRYSEAIDILSDPNHNPVLKMNAGLSQRNVLNDKITELKNNQASVASFKDLVFYAKTQLDVWFAYKTESENKLLYKANVVQNFDNLNIYLSEEYYSYNELIFDSFIDGHTGTYSSFEPLQQVLREPGFYDKHDSKVFQRAYKLYISQGEIYLHEFGLYYNNKILQ